MKHLTQYLSFHQTLEILEIYLEMFKSHLIARLSIQIGGGGGGDGYIHGVGSQHLSEPSI
jgi:hypothetical protein